VLDKNTMELPLSYIEINKNNLVHNFKQFRSLVKNNTQISAVIKSNAYGHGDIEVVKILNPYVDYFQINSIYELKRVRKIAKRPILFFGYAGLGDLEEIIKSKCIISVFDFKHLLIINEQARKLNTKQKVHIAIDSFLGREGFMPTDIEIILIEIKRMKNIAIDGIYSHFANIEDINPDKLLGWTNNFSHAQKQINEYLRILNIFKDSGFKNLKTHISATSGVLAYEKNLGLNSIVRIGIGLYGMWPSEYLEVKYKNKISLKPAMRFISHIAQVKDLPKGYSIGYGLTYITEKNMKVAIIPVGYADGYDRGLSNVSEVLICGLRCRVLGRVAMNMFVVDVSNISKLVAEEEVVLLGKQGAEEISAEEIAKKIDTIHYEIVTRLSPLLTRIIK
jgi:alanine racemase